MFKNMVLVTCLAIVGSTAINYHLIKNDNSNQQTNLKNQPASLLENIDYKLTNVEARLQKLETKLYKKNVTSLNLNSNKKNKPLNEDDNFKENVIAIEEEIPQSDFIALEDSAQQSSVVAAYRDNILTTGLTDVERDQFLSESMKEGLDFAISDLEKLVELQPSINNRLLLADLYSEKVWSVTGRERGVWGEKAEILREEAVAEEPSNWDARFDLARAYSLYPKFLHKTPDAISHFEILKQQQQKMPNESRFSITYLELSSLYRSQGNFEMAREVIQEGLSYHPGDEQLNSQLTVMK